VPFQQHHIQTLARQGRRCRKPSIAGPNHDGIVCLHIVSSVKLKAEGSKLKVCLDDYDL
jgi:hypothetical protein